MDPRVTPPSGEDVSGRTARYIRAGSASLIVASVIAMVSSVIFITHDLPAWFLRQQAFNLEPVRYYYEFLGLWNLSILLLATGIIGLLVGVHALSHEVSIYTMAFASVMVVVGFFAVVNLGLIVALASLIALALFGEAWRLQPAEGYPEGLPSPYGVPVDGRQGFLPEVAPRLMDMEGRSPSSLLRPAATMLIVGSAVGLVMFGPNYPIHQLVPWQQWLLYVLVGFGFAGVALVVYRRLYGVALMAAAAVSVVAFMDMYILLQEWFHFHETLPWTYLIGGPTATMALVYIVIARDAFIPARDTFTSRSSPSPSWSRQRPWP
jgi:hypothetical protein